MKAVPFWLHHANQLIQRSSPRWSWAQDQQGWKECWICRKLKVPGQNVIDVPSIPHLENWCYILTWHLQFSTLMGYSPLKNWCTQHTPDQAPRPLKPLEFTKSPRPRVSRKSARPPGTQHSQEPPNMCKTKWLFRDPPHRFPGANSKGGLINK